MKFQSNSILNFKEMIRMILLCLTFSTCLIFSTCKPTSRPEQVSKNNAESLFSKLKKTQAWNTVKRWYSNVYDTLMGEDGFFTTFYHRAGDPPKKRVKCCRRCCRRRSRSQNTTGYPPVQSGPRYKQSGPRYKPYRVPNTGNPADRNERRDDPLLPYAYYYGYNAGDSNNNGSAPPPSNGNDNSACSWFCCGNPCANSDSATLPSGDVGPQVIFSTGNSDNGCCGCFGNSNVVGGPAPFQFDSGTSTAAVFSGNNNSDCIGSCLGCFCNEGAITCCITCITCCCQ